eukprot:543799-Rhodomonas_salina.2
MHPKAPQCDKVDYNERFAESLGKQPLQPFAKKWGRSSDVIGVHPMVGLPDLLSCLPRGFKISADVGQCSDLATIALLQYDHADVAVCHRLGLGMFVRLCVCRDAQSVSAPYAQHDA